MRTRKIPALIPLSLVAILLGSAGCATIADDYRIPDGFAQVRGYTSVAGNIEVGRKATIGSAKTVSGNIEIGEGSRTGSLSSVSGDVRLAADVSVDGSVKTVAGKVEIARGCTITRDVGTIAGRITLTDSTVKGSVTLTVGELDITRSRIAGAVHIEFSEEADADTAEITIGPGSEVGELVVEKKARVQVRIHRTAKVGAIKGVEPEYYD